MGEMPQPSGSHLTVASGVRCLECGAIYAKPAGAGIVRSNPGCPECGYLGWVGVPDSTEWRGRGPSERRDRPAHDARTA